MSMTGEDTDIPPIQKNDIIFQKLKRLPVITLCKLIIEWMQRFPIKHGHLNRHNINEHLETLLKRKIGRPELAKLIIRKYWKNGLNLFQLAQLDVSILLQHPKSYVWNSHTIYRTEIEKFSPVVIPIEFLQTLQSLFRKQNQKCHIFYKKHPILPLSMFRVLLFENDINDKHYVERVPFYIVFTMSKSPIIIHSNYKISDIFAKLIMQLVKETIMIISRIDSYHTHSMSSSKSADYITLRDENSNSTKDLSQIYITSGIDGSGNPMGSWSNYGKGTSDISPLSNIQTHKSIIGKDDQIRQEQYDNKLELQKKSMLRFHGKESDGDPNYDNDIPVEKVKFTLENHIDDDPLSTPVIINFEFAGKDVFGGIQELCDKGFIDVDRIPGWLCGDNGNKSGRIIDGDFEEFKKRGGLI
ncbi:similar to Saccharomyces cerevisiae YDR254W CHL4 Outer kinetochore protein required for chromosome stability [Maudiozyma saulgeensis]|uniref:Similar to Saccharomyces cerevisiae YDR254W CHL4 Outer kinetochore protein required for chromosome stability n=1 Tax=Maudiozyma saulgeensis TaxID=1789683 RepID=A0A1X7R616_9SACH|nr:similar to Saccharomyces cerevisiae YDR254W CHL4 Outer kinetochore protein required for chromosome stability [Kazachstania saulgeensis]